MKTKLKIETEVEIKTLHVKAGVRYWEDATVNEQEDEKGDLIPFGKGDYWEPVIDIDSGTVIGWPQGTTASIHYKVCDDGSYYLKDAEGKTVLSIEENYVPKIMCPKERGFGDYIIMDIDANGVIQNWKPTLEDFIEED